MVPALSWTARIGRSFAHQFRRWGQRRHRDDAATVVRAARGTIRKKKYCVLANVSAEGVDARVLQPFPLEVDDAGSFVVWMGTSKSSRKVAQLAADPRATLVYEDDKQGTCVTLVGRMAVVADVEEARRRFTSSMWFAFFPAGADDPDCVLLRFEAQRIEVWDPARGVAPPPFGLRQGVVVRRDDKWQLPEAHR